MKSEMIKRTVAAMIGGCLGLFALPGLAALPMVNAEITFHGDASDLSSFTLGADGEVLEWRSQDGAAASLKPGYLVYGDTCAFYDKTNKVYRINEDGIDAVRLSHYTTPGDNSSLVGAVLYSGNAQKIKFGTVFCVNRCYSTAAKGEQSFGALMGEANSYNYRIMRYTSIGGYEWNPTNLKTEDDVVQGWINGHQGLDYADYGKEDFPHLYTFVSDKATVYDTTATFDALGGAYLQSGGNPTASYAVLYKGSVSEILVYDRQLTDDEIAAVSEYLVTKWKLIGWQARWTGEGATTSWSDAGNWLAGTVPDADTDVVLTGDAKIALGESVTCGRILNSTDGDLTLTLDCAAGGVKLAAEIGADIKTVVNSGKLIAGYNKLPAVNGTITFHGDASDLSSFTLGEGGEVLEWRSQVSGNPSLKPGYMAYATCFFPNATNRVYRLKDQGFDAVRLSHYDDSELKTYTGAVLFFGTGNAVKLGTCFCVNRCDTDFDLIGKNYSITYGTLVGSPTGSVNRFMKKSGQSTSYIWNTANYTDVWVNGNKSELSYEDYGKHLYPHLVTFTSASAKTDIELIGGGYLLNGTTENSTQVVTYKGSINELLIYDRQLTDDEIAAVAEYLMCKWKLKTWKSSWQGGEYEVNAGATLDMADVSKLPRSLSGAGTLALDGDIDLNGGVVDTSAITITGDGGFINSADEAATVRIANEDDLVFTRGLSGKINLEKSGAGTLTLPRDLSYSGVTTLAGGTLKAAAVDYGKFGTVSVHLDASKADSITTDENGYLTAWQSDDAAATVFKGANELYADTRSWHNNPYVATDAEGRTCVRFGRDAERTLVGSFIAKSDKSKIQARTYFFVMRSPSDSSHYGSLLGMLVDYNFRLYRNCNSPEYQWNSANMNEYWMNGEKGSVTFSASQYDKPHLLVIRNNAVNSFDIIGGQYLYKNSMEGDMNQLASTAADMEMYEALCFTTAVSDDDVDFITQHLMRKWNVPEQAEITYVNGGGLSQNTAYKVTANATLDTGDDATKALMTGLTMVASSGGLGQTALPKLTIRGSFDAEDVPLCFVEATEVTSRQQFLSTTGTLSGEFDPITGLTDRHRVKMDTSDAYLFYRLGTTILFW